MTLTTNPRACDLRIGDIVLLPDVLGSTVTPTPIVELALVGDDMILNETVTISMGNRVTILVP